MKIVKMKIRREMKNGGTHYTYPVPYYNKDKVKFLIYEKGAKARGENYQYILVGMKAEDLDSFLGADGIVKDGFKFEATEVTREQAIEDGDKWVDRVDKITDQQKVLKILSKMARNEEVTQAERDAIDPEKAERGINKSKSFTESLDEALGNPKWK